MNPSFFTECKILSLTSLRIWRSGNHSSWLLRSILLEGTKTWQIWPRLLVLECRKEVQGWIHFLWSKLQEKTQPTLVSLCRSDVFFVPLFFENLKMYPIFWERVVVSLKADKIYVLYTKLLMKIENWFTKWDFFVLMKMALRFKHIVSFIK